MDLNPEPHPKASPGISLALWRLSIVTIFPGRAKALALRWPLPLSLQYAVSLLANRNYKPDVVVRAYRPGTQEVGDEGFQAILDYKVGWSPGWIMRSCLQNNHSKMRSWLETVITEMIDISQILPVSQFGLGLRDSPLLRFREGKSLAGCHTARKGKSRNKLVITRKPLKERPSKP